MKSKFAIFAILFLLSLPSIAALVHPGFFQSDDGEWMIIRFSSFHQALVNGQFPVRFLQRLNYGYGYPVANFLYPGFMYLAESLRIVGFGFVDTIKIMFGISMIESAVFTYFWLSKVFGKWPAVIGGLVYLYAPYHLYDLYTRGSVGEILSLATVPFVLWQIERKSFFWTSLGLGALILAHNTLVVLFLPVIVLYVLLRNKNSLFIIHNSLFIGLGLSAFFWIPALYDLSYTVFSQTNVSNWQNYFVGIDLLGYSTIAIFLFGFFLLVQKRFNMAVIKLPMFFLVIGSISIFFATSVSSIFWQTLPVSFIQFPFRFLSVTMLSVSFLTGFIFSQLSKKQVMIGSVVILFLILVSSKEFITPKAFFDKGDSYYATNQATTTVQDEYMPQWVKTKPTKHFENKVEVIEGKGEISNIFSSAKKTSFDIVTKSNAKVGVNTVYFPGWKASLDGKETQILYGNEKGIINIDVPIGKHFVYVGFEETPIRFLSDSISIVSLVALFAIEMKRKNIIKV